MRPVGPLATVVWVAALAFGAGMRLWNLGRQILLDDEMHTVLTSMYVPVKEILSSWKSEDPCLPLAALYRSLLEGGVPFSEMTFRWPLEVASLAAIVVLPWMVLPMVGRRVAVLLAWLLALSPVLAIYGGMVRPYAFVALLAPAATLAVLRWRDGGGLRWGVAGAVSAALCLWFHLGTLPLVAAPFGLVAVETLIGAWRGRGARSGSRAAESAGATRAAGSGDAARAGGSSAGSPHAGGAASPEVADTTSPGIAATPTPDPAVASHLGATAVPPRQLFAVGGLLALLVAAFMVPTAGSLGGLFAAKSGIASFSFELVPPVLRLQAGAALAAGPLALAAAATFWLLAVVGLVATARRRPQLTVYVLLVTLGQWVGLAILEPIGLLNPIILNRYLIGTLPLLLILVAAGVATVVGLVAGALARPASEVSRALRVDVRAEPGPARLRARAPGAGAGGEAAPPVSATAVLRALVSVHTAAVTFFSAAILALFFAAGPYADPEFRSTSFRHAKDFVRFDQPRASLASERVPPFYLRADVQASGGPIAELPFRGGWAATRAHYVYQRVHGAPVVAAEPFGWPCDQRLRLRNHTCAEPARLLESAARYVVVHRDPLAEELELRGGDDTGNRYQPELWQDSARVGGRVARNLRRRWGQPLYRDDRILAWDLDAVRQAP